MNNHLILIFSFGLLTFLVGFTLFPFFIEFLIDFKMGKKIRDKATMGDALIFSKLHSKKSGTPTMGGIVIIGTVFLMVIISILLQKLGYINNSLLNHKETYLPLFVLFTVGFLGAVDDFMNIKGIGRTKGLSLKFKLLWLVIFSFLAGLWFYYDLGWGTRQLDIPFYGGHELGLGLWFIPLFMFIIVATSNSVNFTDGLDGLAGGLLLFCYSVYAYITYDQGLFLLSTLCVSIIGSLVAFLWFNIKPAKIYMGDVGSLALGANLGLMAMLTNTIDVFIVICTIFIFETLSIIIQLTSKKFRNGKKVFRIAPFHHHLEAIGWREETVVFRLRIIGLLLSVGGMIFYMIERSYVI